MAAEYRQLVHLFENELPISCSPRLHLSPRGGCRPCMHILSYVPHRPQASSGPAHNHARCPLSGCRISDLSWEWGPACTPVLASALTLHSQLGLLLWRALPLHSPYPLSPAPFHLPYHPLEAHSQDLMTRSSAVPGPDAYLLSTARVMGWLVLLSPFLSLTACT